MTIYIASDHAGFKLKAMLKEFLTESGQKVEDLGPYDYDVDDDYPDYAVKVCEKVLADNGKGILVCGSGQGMAQAANKIPGIHAALCWDEASAKVAKQHVNANVLCLGERFVKPDVAKKLVKLWLDTPFFLDERHIRRINKIKQIEAKYAKKKVVRRGKK